MMRYTKFYIYSENTLGLTGHSEHADFEFLNERDIKVVSRRENGEKLSFSPIEGVEIDYVRVKKPLIANNGLNSGRALIVHKRIMKIFEEYYLAPHTAYHMRFPDHDGTLNEDYYYLFFYTDQCYRLDYENMIIQSYEKGTMYDRPNGRWNYVPTGKHHERCENYSTYKSRSSEIWKQDKVHFRIIDVRYKNKQDYCFDLLGFFSEDGIRKFVISQRLLERLKKEKVNKIEADTYSRYNVLLPKGYTSYEELYAELERTDNLPPKGIQEIRDGEMYIDPAKMGVSNALSPANELKKLAKVLPITALKKFLKSEHDASVADIQYVVDLIKNVPEEQRLAPEDEAVLRDFFEQLAEQLEDTDRIEAIAFVHGYELDFDAYVKVVDAAGNIKSIEAELDFVLTDYSAVADPNFYDKREDLEDPLFNDEEVFEVIDQRYKLTLYRAIQLSLSTADFTEILSKLPWSDGEIACGEHDMDRYVVWAGLV